MMTTVMKDSEIRATRKLNQVKKKVRRDRRRKSKISLHLMMTTVMKDSATKATRKLSQVIQTQTKKKKTLRIRRV